MKTHLRNKMYIKENAYKTYTIKRNNWSSITKQGKIEDKRGQINNPKESDLKSSHT